MSEPIDDKSIICNICKLEFSSKTKLFRHLTIQHGYESEYHNSAKYQRVVLLFGWISSTVDSIDNDIWDRDALQCASGSVGLNYEEEHLFKAVYAVENDIALEEVPVEAYNRHPKGYSRCSRSSQMSALDLVYQKVLTLLREADRSGHWPHSSTARQKVLDNWTNGGSFSVGSLPKHLVQPKGNAIFPDLMKACFELETLLCPDRTPSGTIAINRHAQFKPHRDSGAGNGQSPSLIVGLGDYSGGELLVEGVIHDIRYHPLTFDGWSQRHSTLSFVGERYTLVWFTPMGVERDDMFWLN
eukprot:gene17159-22674_t